jgi:quinol monooxygenase YgiN
MVIASISFRSQPYKRSEILSAVDDTVERMRRTDGCERCRLVVDAEDPNAFTIVSEWRVERDVEAFFSSRDFQIFRGARMLLRDDPVLVLDEVRCRATRVVRAQ